jgi:hypothetical protein
MGGIMRRLVLILFELVIPALVYGQEALPIHVHFAFGTTAADSRFRSKSKQDIERQINAALAVDCTKALRPWRCDTAQNATSANIGVSIQVHNDKWYLKTLLIPQPTVPDLKSEWNDQQIFTGEQLIASGLPMDDGWIAPVTAAFDRVIDQKAQSGKELFASLKQVAPLGTMVASVPVDTMHPTPGAVLPLLWDHYQQMAGCRVRIYYRGKGGEIVSILSSGSGPLDFTPDSPQFKGVWVLHESYQVGGRQPDPIGAHIQDLSDLKVIEFHLEDAGTLPPGLSVAP